MCPRGRPDETLVLGNENGREPRLPKDKSYSLVVVAGKDAGQEYRIDRWTIIIGRDASVSDLVLDDPGASRSHACLEFEKQDFVIEDLESTNGLSVNEKPVARASLRHGDKITIGKTVLQYLVENSAQPGGKVYQIDDVE